MVEHKSQVLPLSSEASVGAAMVKKPLSVFPKPSFSVAVLLLLLPFFLLTFIYLFLYPQEFQLQSFIASYNSIVASSATAFSYAASSDVLTAPVTREPDFRLLIGVLTRADLYERRHLLRLVYALQMANLTAHIDVRFVFCRLYKDDQRILVPLEIMQYDDIIILDCEENLNDGKTYTYFSSIAKLYGEGAVEGGRPPYDYVMKADDDIFVRLPALIESLRPMPRHDMYYGAVIPCDSMDPFRDYMSGMGYILSWDLVEWIGSSEAVRNKSAGTEDMLTGEWLRTAGKGKNRFNAKPAMYDFPIPVPIDSCSHPFILDTVAVHRLKDNPKWATTLKYFNFTQGLKPSKFYHVD